MGSSQIGQSDVVAVKFQFVNHSGKSDSRTILIEKGMQIDLDGAKYNQNINFCKIREADI